ncbi:MAG: hypothetical protein DRR19_11550 [Candidatus Parabeggiatoa sp. nov. 1]|nr:MAG: hypothetical protein DRR19_11550 [Gammaproteobacteria bacterium]
MSIDKQVQEIMAFIDTLPPHDKLQELSKVMLFRGRYRILKEAVSNVKYYFVLDLVNYSKILFPDPLPVQQILNIFTIEPGYGSLTGNFEIGDVVREFEISRACAFANQQNLPISNIREVIEDTTVAATCGATGGVYMALMASLARERAVGKNRTGIVVNVPTYCLSDAFARLNGLTPIPVAGTREQGFFPSLDQVREACHPASVFACVLTYPNNPAQTSFGANEIPALLRLIEHCQSNQIELIADTVFQELRWLTAPPVPELFAFADSAKYLCKVFSPSKDRPFACGYRIGYLMADKGLVPWLERIASCSTSSPSTLGQIWLGIDSVFRRAMIEGELTQDMFVPLTGSSVFGFGGKSLDAGEIYQRICDTDLYNSYVKSLGQFMGMLDQGLEQLWSWLNTNEYFEVDERPPYGNTLLVRVPKQAAFQNDIEYYFSVLLKTGVVGSMGSCFGMPSEEYIYFRVVVASYPPELLIAALEHVKDSLNNHKAPEHANLIL